MNKPSLKTTFSLFTMLLLLLMSILPAGCGQTKPPASQTPAPGAEQTMQLTLYFPKSDASGLAAVERLVTVQNQDVLKVLFTELTKPPAGMENPLPAGTVLLKTDISKEGLATLDLSAEFSNNFNGGSAAEEMTLYSIVNTVTALPDIKSVQFLMEGQKSASLLGSVDTATPFTRKGDLIVN